MHIEPIQEQDIEALIELAESEPAFQFEAQDIAGFWTQEQLLQWIREGHDILLKAVVDGQLVGFFLTQIHSPTRKAVIENIYVIPSMRRQGVAKLLLQEGLRQLAARQVSMVTALIAKENRSSLGFFEEHQFAEGGTFTWMYKMP